MPKRIFTWMVSSSGLRWIAVSFLLLAFVLVSFSVVPGDGVWYQLINITGSSLMIASCLMMKPKDWAVAIFNTIWILVGLFALAHITHLI